MNNKLKINAQQIYPQQGESNNKNEKYFIGNGATVNEI